MPRNKRNTLQTLNIIITLTVVYEIAVDPYREHNTLSVFLAHNPSASIQPLTQNAALVGYISP
jgi:hypothetical protein